MFSSNNLRRVAIPALVLFLVNLVVCYFTVWMFDWGSHFIYQLIVQFFAYATCFYFVLWKGKSQNHVWINYIVWMAIMNAGRVWSFFTYR